MNFLSQLNEYTIFLQVNIFRKATVRMGDDKVVRVRAVCRVGATDI